MICYRLLDYLRSPVHTCTTAAMLQKLQILVVEDSVADAELVAHALRSAQFDPYWHLVDNESDYLSRLGPELDLIISDFSLPQFSGMRALELLKQRDFDIPFIVISGTIGEEMAVETLRRGADDYLLKDRLARLGPSVRHVLEQTRLRRENKTAERALIEGEKKFRKLFDSANDSIYMIHEGVFVDCNLKGQSVYGRTREQILGHSPDEFCPLLQPDGRNSKEKALEIIARALDGEPQFFEWLSSHVDGSAVHSEVSLNQMEFDGKVYLQAIARDITERKRAEERNLRSLALLRTTLDSTTDGILTIGPDKQILSYNDNFLKMWRMPAELMAANDDLAVAYVLDQLVEPEQFQTKVKHLYDCPLEESFDVLDFKDGRVFERFSVPMLVNDRPAGRVWSFRDVTGRKLAERRIAEQAALLDKATDAIIVRELQGNILFWNKGAERMYGWTSPEVIGRSVLDIIHTDVEKFENVNGTLASRGEWKGELQHLTKDHRRIISEAHSTLIQNYEGHPEAVLSINTDITEKKKLEAQFMRAQRMESIGTLAGGVAHDLNNILTPIMMSIAMLKPTSGDLQTTKILELIEVSAKRGADIVKQVLSFARGLEGEKVEIQPKHLLGDIQNIITETFPKGIRLRLSIPYEPWTLLGDPTQLHQVLLNLCVNARDAMPQGGELTLSVENCVLNEQYAGMTFQAKAGRYVDISVTDSGTGIPADLLDKIFEPFFTTKDINKGTGLGLSTVMAIVKNHHGVINVHSEPGHGTTFKVHLPAMEPHPESHKHELDHASLPRGNGETILVIDDEPIILAITSRTLQAYGYHVLTAADGAQAIAVYARHERAISAVLTDMMMPVMDGAATIHALKQINPLVKIVATSGINANESMSKAADLGVQHFITKPNTAETLLTTIRSLLDQP